MANQGRSGLQDSEEPGQETEDPSQPVGPSREKYQLHSIESVPHPTMAEFHSHDSDFERSQLPAISSPAFRSRNSLMSVTTCLGFNRRQLITFQFIAPIHQL